MAKAQPKADVRKAHVSQVQVSSELGPLPGWARWMAIIGIVAYTALFYACPIETLSQVFGRPFRRLEVFTFLLLPEQIVIQWLGRNHEVAFFDRCPIFAMAALYVGASYLWGRLLLKLLPLGRLFTFAEQTILACLVGLTITSNFIVLVGLLWMLQTPWLIWGWITIPFVLVLVEASLRGFRTRKARINAPSSGVKKNQETFEISSQKPFSTGVLTAIFVSFSITLLFGAVLPPTDFDVREYHLQAPKEFYQLGGIQFLPHNVYANMPLGVQVHALGGMMLFQDVRNGALLGKVVIAVFAILGAGLLHAWVTRLNCLSTGLVAAVTFLTIPWVLGVSAAGLIDIAFATTILAAAFVLAALNSGIAGPSAGIGAPRGNYECSAKAHEGPNPREQHDRKDGTVWPAVLLSGLLAGSAAGIKYTGVVYAVVPLLGVILWFTIRKWGPVSHGWRSTALAAGVFLLGALAGGGVWYYKNLVFSSNPVYPLAYSLFDGLSWDPEKASRWSRVHSPHDFSGLSLLKGVGRVAITSEWQSAVVIPLAALGWLDRKRQSKLLLPALMSLWIVSIWWLFTHRIDRFWLPVLPFLCIFAGTGVELARRSRMSWVVYLAMSLSIIWAGLLYAVGALSYNRFLAPLRELWDDPERIGREHVLLNQLFAELPPNSQLLAVGEAAVFDLQMPVLYATCFDDQPWETITKGRTPEEISAELRRLNVNYVYVNWLEIARYRSPGNYGFTDYVQPAQFRRLVEAGVLLPVLIPPETPNQIFLVK